MRVAMYYNNRDVRLEEIPRPRIGPGELLMKVMASGICGSDVMAWYRKKRAPRVLGHEATGVIEEVGEGVTGYKVGERVFVSHHVPCGSCRYCLSGHETACETLHTTNYDPGGFSEYIRVPRINVERGVYRLPNHVSFEEGTFIEPLACVVRGQRIAGVKGGDSVLIIGSGVSGILHIQMAKLNGAGRVIAADISEYKMRKAGEFGADDVLDARGDVERGIRDILGRGADRVIVCAGAAPAAQLAFRCVDRGGSILFFAVPPPEVPVQAPLVDFWRNEITIATSYGAAPRDLSESLGIISDGKVRVREMITHRLGLAEAGAGFRMMSEQGECLKIIIEPWR
ncbi:MAG: alcohol dehydrogenase catalytic domain-containing protein [Candidatus Hadarchaeales archaeon]